MPIPTWTVGEVLASNDVNQWFVPLAAIRASDSTPIVNTTLTNDDTLFLPLATSATYKFEMGMRYSGSATGGIKWKFTVPTGTTGIFWGAWFGASGGTFQDGNAVGDTSTQTIGTLNALYDSGWWGTFTTSSTSGNLQLQVAENATDGVHGTFLRAGSYLTAQRIG